MLIVLVENTGQWVQTKTLGPWLSHQRHDAATLKRPGAGFIGPHAIVCRTQEQCFNNGRQRGQTSVGWRWSRQTLHRPFHRVALFAVVSSARSCVRLVALSCHVPISRPTASLRPHDHVSSPLVQRGHCVSFFMPCYDSLVLHPFSHFSATIMPSSNVVAWEALEAPPATARKAPTPAACPRRRGWAPAPSRAGRRARPRRPCRRCL